MARKKFATEEDYKEYRKIYIREWQKNNPKKIKANSKKFYQNNREYYSAYSKSYRAKNLNKLLIYNRNYYKENREYFLEKFKCRYLNKKQDNEKCLAINMKKATDFYASFDNYHNLGVTK